MREGGEQMKCISWRMMLGCFAVFVFACLLLSGAQRLIAVDRQDVSMDTLSCREAWLCSMPSSTQDQQTSRQRSEKTYGDAKWAIHPQNEYADRGRMQRQRDANGNVLSGGNSYLHAVYRAFPLGDGFA